MADGLNLTGDFSLDQVLAKRLVTPGGSVAPGVAPEMFACVVLEQDRPEWQYLYGGGRYARGGNIAAGGALTRSSLSLVNSRNDTLCVVERVQVTAAAGGVFARIGTLPIGVLPAGTNVIGRSVDTRNFNATVGTTGLSVTALVTDNTLGSSTDPLIAIAPSGVLDLSEPIILGPGGRLYLSPDADNVAISGYTVFFRERRLNPSERL